MKKAAIGLTLIIIVSFLGSCAPSNISVESDANGTETYKPVEITVVTSFGGDDGNRLNYEKAYKAYEMDSLNIVKDMSGISNEEWKASVMSSFENSSEPDVLFYFTGADSNKLVSEGKVVSLEEIRQAYPDYASNMKDELLAKSPVDGKNYAVPVNGYWEGLYINKTVLEACSVDIPDENTTWEEFLRDCEKIAAEGYIPIAASLNEVPHYWFEFCVLNNGSVSSHIELPESSQDAIGKIWAAGLYDIKELYERGFFPEDTLTMSGTEADVLLISNKAAFMIEGSWKLGWLAENALDINNFTVAYVPGKGERKAADIIGGISMGYFITRKAWDDQDKRAACVDFVSAMSLDNVVAEFGPTSVTALKKGLPPPEDASNLVTDALSMVNHVSSVVPAAGDNLGLASRADLFGNVKNIVSGKITAEEAIDQCLKIEN